MSKQNFLGWHITFCGCAPFPFVGWKDNITAAEAAIAMLKSDIATGVKKFLIAGHGHAREYRIWTLYLQDYGIEIHLACSDELFGHEDVFIDVYNSAAKSLDWTKDIWDYENWSEKTTKSAEFYPELVEQRKRLEEQYDKLR